MSRSFIIYFTVTGAKKIGTLRSEDGDGSENVAEKVNSHSFNLHRDYSKSLTLSNVGEPSQVEFLRTISKFKKREEISSSLVYFLFTS